MGYYITMIVYYGYQIGMCNAEGFGHDNTEQIQHFKQERFKHTAVVAFAGLSLLFHAISALQDNR